MGLIQAAGSSQGSDYRNHMCAREVLESFISHIKDLFCCLIDGNAALHNSRFAAHTSQLFCSSTNSSSVTPYGGRDDTSGSYYTSSSASTVAHTSASEIIDPETGVQHSFHETEQEAEEIILKRFVQMIGQIVELSHYFCEKKYDPSILISPFNRAFKDVLKEKMASLGFHDVERNFQEMFAENWASTERPMLSETRKKFVQAYMRAINVIFPWQKCLCDEVFFHLPGFAKAFYTAEADYYVQQLVNFADGPQSDIPHTMEKLFQLLHVREVLRVSSSNINILYPGPGDSEFVGGQQNAKLISLKKAITDLFNKLWKQILNDTSVDPSFGRPGNINKDVGISRLTRKVVGFVTNRSWYSKSPDDILICTKVYEERIRDEETFLFGQHVLLVVSYLITNIQKKADILINNNSEAAAHIFWINNCSYIVRKLERVAMANLLERAIEEQKNKIEQHLTNYISSTWGTTISHLNPPNRDSARKFITAVKGIINTQASWNVSDAALCGKLRETVSDAVVPDYRQFLENHFHSEVDNNSITAEELRTLILNLFEATGDQ